jgi:hypothetical protein
MEKIRKFMIDTMIMPVARDTKKINQALKRLQALGLNDPHQLLDRARKGAHSTVFYDLALVGNLTENLLASIINISARTILNYAQQGKKLEPAQSEHLLKLVLLFELGITAFGTADEFNIWLNKKFWNAKDAPMDWLITPGGVDMVKAEIEQLMEGYPV